MIKDLLESGKFDIAEVAKAFDAMSEPDLVRETRACGQKAQEALWNAAKGWQRMTFDDLVPPGTPNDTGINHQGRNTLPAFNIFQKRFARPSSVPAEIWGYNEQVWKWLTGPGSFIVTDHDGELWIENMRTPAGTIPGWPEPESNAGFLNGLTYGNLIDTLRKVSKRVSIGMPAKKGKPLGSYFILARLGG